MAVESMGCTFWAGHVDGCYGVELRIVSDHIARFLRYHRAASCQESSVKCMFIGGRALHPSHRPSWSQRYGIPNFFQTEYVVVFLSYSLYHISQSATTILRRVPIVDLSYRAVASLLEKFPFKSIFVPENVSTVVG